MLDEERQLNLNRLIMIHLDAIYNLLDGIQNNINEIKKAQKEAYKK